MRRFAALLALPLLVGAGSADRVLELLRQTDALRQDEAREAQAWKEEEARVRLLLGSLEEQTDAARRDARRARATLEALRAEAPPPPEAVLERLESGAVEVAEAIHAGLDRLARSAPPGLIEPRGPGRPSPRQALDDALHRLERAERAAGEIEVTVESGRLGDATATVELLRFGGVAAWWRSLDGDAGGEARTVDGQVILHPVEDPSVLESIARASAVAKGRRAPEVVQLPVRHARMEGEDEIE